MKNRECNVHSPSWVARSNSGQKILKLIDCSFRDLHEKLREIIKAWHKDPVITAGIDGQVPFGGWPADRGYFFFFGINQILRFNSSYNERGGGSVTWLKTLQWVQSGFKSAFHGSRPKDSN